MNAYDEMMRLYDVAANKEYKIGELEDTVAELKDALEFEARVSARLACTVENLQNLFPQNEMIVIPKETILRDVRIAVESEMDKE